MGKLPQFRLFARQSFLLDNLKTAGNSICTMLGNLSLQLNSWIANQVK